MRAHGPDEWSAWIGRTTSSDVVLDSGPANRLAVTLDLEPHFAEGTPLPPAWHWLYFHELVMTSDLGADGHPEPGITIPAPVPPRRMWASGRMEFVDSLEVGQTARRISTITSVTPKDGRTGRLVFVTINHLISTDRGVAVREEQSIVYREAARPTGGHGPSARTDSDFTDVWQLDTRTLFRYSALTFNAHRIHYDADYARNVEGYPGLVVHGPLLVTLLLHAAARRGIEVADVQYRAVSPVHLPHAFSVHGRRDGDEVALWAASGSGHLAMDATATTRQEIL